MKGKLQRIVRVERINKLARDGYWYYLACGDLQARKRRPAFGALAYCPDCAKREERR